MNTAQRRTLIGSAIAATLVAVLTVWDLFAVYPWQVFGGQTVFDILYFTTACIVLYLCYDAWQELS